jgi:hypothetical protein
LPRPGRDVRPTTDWVVQQARNLLMDLDEAGATMKYLIHDRDVSFSAAFEAVFIAADIEVIRTGIRAPRQNSIMERWFRSLRAELTGRFTDEAEARCETFRWIAFYNHRRRHTRPDNSHRSPSRSNTTATVKPLTALHSSGRSRMKPGVYFPGSPQTDG